MVRFLLLFFCTTTFTTFAQETPASDNTVKPDGPVVADSTTKPKKSGMLSMGPTIMDFKLDRGQSGRQTFNIINKKNKHYTFKMNIKDYVRDSAGNYQFMDPGKNPYSLSEWITFDKTSVEVAPGERATVVITVTVPDNEEAAKAMRWAMVLAETVSDEEDTKKNTKDNVQMQMNKAVSTGIHVFLEPPGLPKELKMLSVNGLNDSTYRVLCQNTGATKLNCKFSLEFSSPSTGAKDKIEVDDVGIFPGQQRFVDMKIPSSLKPGKYVAVALIDAGDDDVPLEAAQLSVEIK